MKLAKFNLVINNIYTIYKVIEQTVPLKQGKHHNTHRLMSTPNTIKTSITKFISAMDGNKT